MLECVIDPLHGKHCQSSYTTDTGIQKHSGWATKALTMQRDCVRQSSLPLLLEWICVHSYCVRTKGVMAGPRARCLQDTKHFVLKACYVPVRVRIYENYTTASGSDNEFVTNYTNAAQSIKMSLYLSFNFLSQSSVREPLRYSLQITAISSND